VAVVYPNNQHRDAQDVREQDKLLALVVCDVAGPREQVYPLEPLLLSEFHLADERVQVPDEALHDLPESLRLGVSEAREHCPCEILVSKVVFSTGGCILSLIHSSFFSERSTQIPFSTSVVFSGLQPA
jgi:hypothetical protein